MNVNDYMQAHDIFGHAAIQAANIDGASMSLTRTWYVLGAREEGDNTFVGKRSDGVYDGSTLGVTAIEITGETKPFYKGNVTNIKVTFTNSENVSMTKDAHLYTSKTFTAEDVKEFVEKNSFGESK